MKILLIENKFNKLEREAFHAVFPSPWPITGSLGSIGVAVGLVCWFLGITLLNLFLGFLLVIITIFNWWRDVIREAFLLGYHNSYVKNLIRSGIIFFITSEVIFFFSFFWAYFHSSLAPSLELGGIWPPTGIDALRAFGIPLFGTVILLTSRAILTHGHHCLFLEKKKILSLWDLLVCSLEGVGLRILLGIVFLLVQYSEYRCTTYYINSSVYGSVFFLTTGFHGLHVFLGVLFLSVIIYRIFKFHFSENDHVGFEGSVWYWHFVDVVWLFLFITVYWWGNIVCY